MINYSIIQLVIAIALIVLILLQQRGGGISGLLGGGDAGGVYQTRRGLERFVFIGTIVLAVLFAAVSIARLVL
jgi:protein translocase SecG subunit